MDQSVSIVIWLDWFCHPTLLLSDSTAGWWFYSHQQLEYLSDGAQSLSARPAKKNAMD